jgi:hypothetical protein
MLLLRVAVNTTVWKVPNVVFVEAEALAGWTIRVGGWLELPPQPMSNPPIRTAAVSMKKCFMLCNLQFFQFISVVTVMFLMSGDSMCKNQSSQSAKSRSWTVHDTQQRCVTSPPCHRIRSFKGLSRTYLSRIIAARMRRSSLGNSLSR